MRDWPWVSKDKYTVTASKLYYYRYLTCAYDESKNVHHESCSIFFSIYHIIIKKETEIVYKSNPQSKPTKQILKWTNLRMHENNLKKLLWIFKAFQKDGLPTCMSQPSFPKFMFKAYYSIKKCVANASNSLVDLLINCQNKDVNHGKRQAIMT